MERDKRGLHLAAGGVILTLLAFVAGLVAALTSNWATFTGAMSGNFGPWSSCQDGHNVCRRVSSIIPLTWASSVTGVGSIGCAILLGIAAVLAALILWMHITFKKCIVKFRHATLGKMVCIAAGALCGFLSVIFFVLEIFIFGAGTRSGLFVSLSWSFYLQMISLAVCIVAGAGAGIEFGWSRKLGGDPTVYTRDPEGTAATTISNPHFRENGHANHAKKSSSRNNSSSSSSRGRSHRNANGVAMTHMSGLPYMVTANGNGHLGHRSNGGVAFDPNKTPLRSSLKRSKVPSEDSTDATTMGIQNLAFTQSSPPSKKKVRIHTHSTPV
ncbi:uncharacterized protein LOC135219621 isoform X2 [Macrobrachium nipponense]|uniref:uncharacterized protein LOC135219621 isoform X2 n=1 Tax=Macrobrachium nipponense TaxID=159736 RepID=UPI0030C7F6AF